jgi:hypothetical protein
MTPSCSRSGFPLSAFRFSGKLDAIEFPLHTRINAIGFGLENASMIFAGVRLPDPVRIALENGSLVIFAGAGISMPPPANLPSFAGLTHEISQSNLAMPGKEDQILGKLKRAGTDVHRVAAAKLDNPTTRPTEGHKQILRLFGTLEKVRIVTTNFDNHFSDAARKVFRKGIVTEFHAPALPLGDNFEGIVYLHGTAKDPRTMVLSEPPSLYLSELQKTGANSITRDKWSFLTNLKPLFTKSREWGYPNVPY